jgi:hypothetical protein
MVPANSSPPAVPTRMPVPQSLCVVLIKSYALMELANRPLLCVLLFLPAQQDRRSVRRIGNATLQQIVQAQVSKPNALQLLLFYARMVHARAQSRSVVSRQVVLRLPHVVGLFVRMGLARLVFKLVWRLFHLCCTPQLPSLQLLL